MYHWDSAIWNSLRLGLLGLLAIAAASAATAQNAADFEQRVDAFISQGHFDRAGALADEFIAAARARDGEFSADFATGLERRAIVTWTKGDLRGAEPLLRRALEIDRLVLGPEHANIARDLGSLGNLLQELGQFEEAERLVRAGMEQDERIFGPGHTKVGVDANNLGLLLREQGRYADAESYLQRALAITESSLGADAPQMNTRLRNLAALYRDQGRLTDAERLLLRARQIVLDKRGAAHPDFAACLAILGRVYRDMSRFEDAEESHLSALAIRRAAFGPDNIRTAFSLVDLALLYADLGRFAEAVAQLGNALVIREREFGPEHPITAFTLVSLALLNEKQGKLDEAEQIYRRALAIQQQKLPPLHPDLATTRFHVASLLKGKGNLTEALSLMESALALREASLAPDHPAIAASLLQLSELYRLLGRADDAEAAFRRALRIRKASIKTIPVYFATDRKREGEPHRVSFGTERDLSGVTLGIARTGLLDTPQSGKRSASARDLRPEGDDSTDVNRITLQSVDILTNQDSLFEGARRAAASAKLYPGSAILFVHGYNVSFENAARRVAQIAYDLQFDGPVFAYSWPSRQAILGYASDRDTVDLTSEHLSQVLVTMSERLGGAKLHVIAHSMGNMVLLRALSTNQRTTATKLPLGAIINAAPDVDPELFDQFSKPIRSAGGTFTVYASSTDRALLVSGILRTYNPIGYIGSEGPVTLSGVDVIDIANAGTTIFSLNHDVYASSPIITADMRKLIGGIRPPDRRTKAFVEVAAPRGTYWIYRTSK